MNKSLYSFMFVWERTWKDMFTGKTIKRTFSRIYFLDNIEEMYIYSEKRADANCWVNIFKENQRIGSFTVEEVKVWILKNCKEIKES